MAKWSFAVPTWTPVAVADTVAMTSNGYIALTGGTATQVLTVMEIYLGGQAGASSPTIMMAARDSTLATTPTALAAPNTLTQLNPATAALGTQPVGQVAAAAGPQRHATQKLLNLSFNAFGGIVRWVAAPGEELGLLGTAAATGELSVSAFTGGTPGLLGSTVIYEPL